jgi:phosphoglycerate dehydrogenase-like enzyme
MENVILSPHEAGATQRQWQRIGEIFLDNLRRYRAGDELRNLVDRGQGY